jgi:hypothetical protein
MVDQKVIDFGTHSRELLSSLGLHAPAHPSTELVFPNDLGKLSDDEVSAHLSYWASMTAYAHQKVSVLEGALVLAKSDYELEYDLRLYNKAGNSVSERKIGLGASKVLRQMKVRIAVIEADLKVLKSILVGYDLKNSAVSREITRRNNERNLRDG